jgi:hypothetical protein
VPQPGTVDILAEGGLRVSESELDLEGMDFTWTEELREAQRNRSVKRRPKTKKKPPPEKVEIGNAPVRVGAEGRFSAKSIAADAYTKEDMAGHYFATDGRELHVMRWERAPGGLVLYDARSGLLRGLSHYGNMAYAYGPGLLDVEPVQGTLFFMPSHSHTKELNAPSRVMWMPPGGSAKFGNKFYMDRWEVSFPSDGAKLSGRLLAPERGGPFPVVLWLPSRGAVNWNRFERLAPLVGMAGYAVMAFDNRGYGGSTGNALSVTSSTLAGDAAAALEYLRGLPNIAGAGVWAESGMVGPALLGVAGEADFFLARFHADSATGLRAPPRADALRRARPPALWLFSGPDAAGLWSDHLAAVRQSDAAGAGQVVVVDMPGGDRTAELGPAPWMADIRRAREFLRGLR